MGIVSARPDTPSARGSDALAPLMAPIASLKGVKEAEARLHFTETSKADWFGYYGLRARMHLASGRGALGRLRPARPLV